MKGFKHFFKKIKSTFMASSSKHEKTDTAGLQRFASVREQRQPSNDRLQRFGTLREGRRSTSDIPNYLQSREGYYSSSSRDLAGTSHEIEEVSEQRDLDEDANVYTLAELLDGVKDAPVILKEVSVSINITQHNVHEFKNLPSDFFTRNRDSPKTLKHSDNDVVLKTDSVAEDVASKLRRNSDGEEYLEVYSIKVKEGEILLSSDGSMTIYKKEYTGFREFIYEAAVGGLIRDSSGSFIGGLKCYFGQTTMSDQTYLELLGCLMLMVYTFKSIPPPKRYHVVLDSKNAKELIYAKKVDKKYETLVGAIKALMNEQHIEVKVHFNYSPGNKCADVLAIWANQDRKKLPSRADLQNPKVYTYKSIPALEELERNLQHDREGKPRFVSKEKKKKKK